MSQLIYLRQRIKAVETTKKITHAMRLISMSTHSRLKNKKNLLKHYNKEIDNIIQLIGQDFQKEIDTQTSTTNNHLAILIGSQKGLCGTFNANNFRHFEHETDKTQSLKIIAIGKYAIDYLKQQNIAPIVTYTDFTSNQFISIAQKLSSFIWDHKSEFDTIKIYYNKQQSFFIQKPTTFQIWPLEKRQESAIIQTSKENTIEYILEESAEVLLTKIQKIQITNLLQHALLNSLLSEQAARFLSMDSSSRNAENLIIEMKLKYNKGRQAAITQELTELTTGFF